MHGTMRAARLVGPRQMVVEEVALPHAPKPGEVRIAVTVVGVCGSDLHNYEDARIGDTVIESPLILGHEFAGVVVEAAADALDGNDQPLQVGQRVAVDPATPCWRCELCEAGHPNLCRRLHFCGLYPDDGALCEQMNVPARSCFPVPDELSAAAAALLEPLGVALHAVNLAHVRLGDTVVVQGCGPIGLLIQRLIRHSGAGAVYAFDRFPWRAEKAKQWGATGAWTLEEDPIARIQDVTGGRGADIVVEAAWADHSIGQAIEMARLGGRVMLAGIPSADEVRFKHSTARRKGLTIKMVRRMKHVYPRATELVLNGVVDVDDLISHRFPLERAPEAFAMNIAYPPGVQKVMIDVSKA
ncbi:MAG: alcohol dehydrogenase catalytic domain-containing protein [Anaerolineae bacterium]